ncbi:MAG: hypothetical protein WDZ35_06510 [Crocinitomicaceae bacterium]
MNPSNFKKIINLLYTMLALGMIAFTAVTFYLTINDQHFNIPATSDTFLFLVPTVILLAIVVGNFLFQKLIRAVNEAKMLQQKVTIGFTSNIVRFALIEGAILLGVIALLSTANLFYMVFIVIGFMYFISLKPTDKKIKRDLMLSHDEAQELGIM